MLDDLTKEIKVQLYERVKSPLFGAFAFSWVGWNYRGLLAAISDMPFKDKMAYLDGLYPSPEAWGWHCFGWPLLTAIGFLLLYPWPARGMYWYWAKQQKELKKVQQSIEDDTPIMQDEANALRKASLEQVTQVQAQLRDMSQANRELNERLKVLTEDNLRLASERDRFEEAAKKAEEQLTTNRSEVLTPAAEHSESATVREKVQKLYENLPSVIQDALGNYFRPEDTTMRNVFLLLVAAGGEGFSESFADYLNENPIEVRHALSELSKKNLTIDNGGTHTLTNQAVAVTRQLNLTKLLPKVTL